MKNSNRKFLNPLNAILVVLYSILMAYVYIGFFYPDTAIFGINPIVGLILICTKVIFPLITIGILFIYRSLYLKKIKITSVVILTITVIVFLSLIYPIGDYYYKKRFVVDSDKYHTFLQLTPPKITKVDSTNINVFCLGGSTTEFRDKRNRDWPSMVENILQQEYNLKNVKFYNQGKQWYTSQHSLINYIQNIKKIKPDIIIVMHIINDLLMNADFSRFSNGKFRQDYGHFLGPEAFMIRYGSLFGFLKESLSLIWYNDEIQEINTDYFPGLVAFESNIKLLIKLAKNDGTKVILMTQPNLYKDSVSENEYKSLNMLISEAIGRGKNWSYKTALSGMRQYNNIIRDIAKTENVYLIDLEAEIPKSLEYFSDDVHYQSKTFDLISSYVSKQVLTTIK